MTHPDQHADTYAAQGQTPAAGDQTGFTSRQPAPDDTTRGQDFVPEDQVAPRDAQPESPRADGLFADDELAGLRARWNSVQAGFVDDPKDCVQKADSLVADLVQQLTTGFGQTRSRLEEQWARGEQASTEDLRVALMHYRSFFERLLSV